MECWQQDRVTREREHAHVPSQRLEQGRQDAQRFLRAPPEQNSEVTRTDPSDLEHLLNDQPLVTLEEAARSMHGVEFYDGVRRCTDTFDLQRAVTSLHHCRSWAESSDLSDDLQEAKRALQDSEQLRGLGERAGVEGMAAIRAWTGTEMCYVLTTVFRSATGQNLDQVKPYARLFLSALHALPPKFLYEGKLYRTFPGVLQGVEWCRDKQKVDNDENVWHHFYAPTSFSMDPVSASMFKQQAKEAYEPRTEITLFGGVGYKLQAFSVHPDEAEVLVEPVCSCAITRMQDFSGHAHEIPGETTDALQGLHRIELRVKPGIRYAICAHARLRASMFMILARFGADLPLHQSPNSRWFVGTRQGS